MTIRTRWHKMMDAVAAKNINILIGDQKTIHALDKQKSKFDLDRFLSMLKTAAQAPRFFMDDDVLDLALSAESMKTLDAMHECDVLRLPYPSMIVEYSGKGPKNIRVFVTLLEEEKSGHFLCHPLLYNEHNGQEWCYTSPFSVQIEYISPVPLNEIDGHRGVRYVLKHVPFCSDMMTGRLQEGDYKFFSEITARGLLAALVLLHTKGIAKETVPGPAPLNKARAKKGKAPIPDCITIKLGSYQTREGREVKVLDGQRRPPRIHIRRGHTRNVRYGPGRGAGERPTRPVFVEAVLVNYDAEEHGGKVPQYHVKV